jgi:hypothetical protein
MKINAGSGATFVGSLRVGALAVDIDPMDARFDAAAGVTACDDMSAWCDRQGLDWISRASGRPGHRHLVVLIPDSLGSGFRAFAREVGARHQVSVTVRSSLRPLSAPHRRGLPAPVLDGTLMGAVIKDELPPQVRASAEDVREQDIEGRMPDPGVPPTPSRSRSEAEFGDTLARVRAGWGKGEAWNAACRPGTKAAEMGWTGWGRWVWSAAVTIVDAERGLTPSVAWENFRSASPDQAAFLGYARWYESRWVSALEEARRERPRRTRTSPRAPSQLAKASSVHAAPSGVRDIEVVANGMIAAACWKARNIDRLPNGVRLASLCAALRALGGPVVARRGSISVRAWSERSRLDPKTVRRARDAAVELGLIYRRRAYSGDQDDSDAWLPTELTVKFIQEQKSPTGRYAPYRKSVGRSNVARLAARHSDERERWKRFLERKRVLATSRMLRLWAGHREAAEVRPVVAQLCWWHGLNPDEKTRRRRERRAVLKRLDPGTRTKWHDWLGRRRTIARAITSLAAGNRTAYDLEVIRDVPSVVRLGLNGLDAWSSA